ncbi:MAG: hypothetical protein ACE5Q6_14835 [Dehalococcoidia bacterium]
MSEKTDNPLPDSSKVWESPRVKAILEQPEGTPIDTSILPKEEIAALAQEASGTWVDHPDIKDSVEWVRSLREGMYRESIEE